MVVLVFIRNKILMTAFMLVPLLLAGQEVKVVRTERIARDLAGILFPCAVSPDGKNILITDEGFRGLVILNPDNGTSARICDDQGAGYSPAFSSAGDKIWYRRDFISGIMKYSEMVEYDLISSKTRIIQERSRSVSPPQAVNDHIVYSVGGQQKTDPSSSKSGDQGIYAVLEDLVPVIYINGIRKILKPNGEGNYIWLSLSPDRTKLLYNHLGKTTYICDLNGKIIANLGRFNAPQWLTDQVIVGMNDRDDGYRVLTSDIICYSVPTGKTTSLTSTPGKIEMFPLAFPGGKRVVYQTIEGELYLMDLTIK